MSQFIFLLIYSKFSQFCFSLIQFNSQFNPPKSIIFILCLSNFRLIIFSSIVLLFPSLWDDNLIYYSIELCTCNKFTSVNLRSSSRNTFTRINVSFSRKRLSETHSRTFRFSQPFALVSLYSVIPSIVVCGTVLYAYPKGKIPAFARNNWYQSRRFDRGI